MKKISMFLTAVLMLTLTTLASAIDVKISGKVDVRQDFSGLSAVDTTNEYNKTGFNLREFNVREAKLTAKAVINDKFSAQISNNFAGSNNFLKDRVPNAVVFNNQTAKYDTTYDSVYAGLEANNTGIGDTYVDIKALGGNFKIGLTSLPGFEIRETILNTLIFDHKLTKNNVAQVCYAGNMEPVSYNIAIVDGSADENGAASKDAVINVGASLKGASLGLTYYADMNSDSTMANPLKAKDSNFTINAGYSIKPVDFKVQFTTALDEKLTSKGNTNTANEYIDIVDDSNTPAKAPTSELVAEIGLKIGEKHNLSLGYDVLGKADAIIVKGGCKVAEGVSAVLRADMLGSKLKKVIPTANNISLGIVAEF